MRLFALILGISLVLIGCAPAKQKTETPVEEPEATIENQTNLKYRTYEGTLEEGQKMILFFHADWCQTCKNWEERLLSEIDSMPENTLIYKVNYDEEKQLTAQYGITKQSAAVFLDSEGKSRKVSMDPSVASMTHFFNQAEIVKKEVVDPNKLKYQSYSLERAEGNKVALFFSAEWCATCRKWEENLKANLDSLPDEARILKVDYDTAKELVKDYKVTKQSTVVFLDEKGNVAKKLMDPAIEKVVTFFGGAIAEAATEEPVEEKKSKKTKKEVKEEEKKEEKVEEDANDKEEEKATDNTDPITDDEKDSVTELEVEAPSEPRYEAYSAKAVKAEAGKKYILNFSASWCPNCRKLDSELQGMLASLPEGTVVFKTDYDKHTDLKKKYGVTQQTTLVLIKEDGSHEIKASGTIGDIKDFFN